MFKYNKLIFSPSLQVTFSVYTLLFVIFLSGAHKMPDLNSNVNVLQWNCRHIKTNLIQFTQFLHNSKTTYHALCLQSLAVKRSDLPVIPNYFYPPFYSIENDKIRTATYIRKSIKVVSQQPIPNIFNDICDIELAQDKSLRIINTYFPEGCTQENMTRWISDLQSENVLLVGDFNSHHSLWGGSGIRTSRGGQWLFDNISESNLCLLNDGSFTRVPNHNGEQPSVIDLSLISSELFIDSEWMTIDDPLGSDHLPICISIGNVELNRPDSEIKYDYTKANWKLFSDCLEAAIYPDFDVNENWQIDVEYEDFRSIVLTAANAAIPNKPINVESKYPPNPWWNQTCYEAVKTKRQAYKRYKRRQNNERYEILKAARVNCKKVIAKAKVEYWRKYLNKNISHYSDNKILFKHVKKLKQRFCQSEKPLVSDGVRTKNDKEKANVLADVFAKASRSDGLSQKARLHRTREDRNRTDPPTNPNCPLNKDFFLLELRKSIESIKNNKKATGSDPISYRMIQHFPNKTIEYLLCFFNRCYNAGVVPVAWKQATVVAIPKTGKPPSCPKSYRPISLTPHLGKVYERLVKNRLEYHLLKNKTIPLMQAGFQRGRGCTDHIVKISSYIKKSMAKRKTVLSAFYDVYRAYDSVWHGRLLSKLAKIGLSGNMYNFCKTFLDNRSFCVKIGSTMSKSVSVDMGLPQGSIIAPIFFNIMLHDITTVNLKNAQVTLYADDLLLFSTEQYTNLRSDYVKKVIMKRFQYNVDQLVRYMKDNGFELAADKTVFMIFNRSRFNPLDFSISIDNCKINPSDEVKYLGVLIDKKLTWNSHVKRNVDKTKHVWSLLKILKRTEGASDPKNLCHVIMSLVRSRLLYGHEAFFAANKSVLRKLQTAECKFLRYALEMKNSVPPRSCL